MTASVPGAGRRRRVGILISGRGSNMKALLEAAADPTYPAEIVLVAANRPDAGGLAVAQAAGVATAVLDHKRFTDRAAFDAELDRLLRAAGVEIVCLAGFMRLLGAEFVAGWGDHILNIHPSLLPAFKGLHVHERAIAAGVRVTGCTVHIVRPEMDTGPILVQAAVPVLPDDTPDRLAARVLTAEHRCYPLALRLLADGAVRVEDERVVPVGPAPGLALWQG